MAIWRSSPPNPSDFPIWAIHLDNGSPDKLKLYRSLDDLMVGDGTMVWTAVGNQLPLEHVPADIAQAFQELANKVDHTDWSSSDWFIAGFNYAMSINGDGTHDCECGPDKNGCGCDYSEFEEGD